MQYAHLGGVPETLAIAVPAALLVLILRAGRRRAEDEEDAEPGQDEESDAGRPETR